MPQCFKTHESIKTTNSLLINWIYFPDILGQSLGLHFTTKGIRLWTMRPVKLQLCPSHSSLWSKTDEREVGPKKMVCQLWEHVAGWGKFDGWAPVYEWWKQFWVITKWYMALIILHFLSRPAGRKKNLKEDALSDKKRVAGGDLFQMPFLSYNSTLHYLLASLSLFLFCVCVIPQLRKTKKKCPAKLNE